MRLDNEDLQLLKDFYASIRNSGNLQDPDTDLLERERQKDEMRINQLKEKLLVSLGLK